MTIRPSLCVCLTAALVAAARPGAAAGQHRAELEVEREKGATTSRVELYDAAFPLLRAEREQADGATTHRLGVQLPGRALGLDGYLSMFLEDRPDRTALGATFEVGRGVPMIGGSIERDDDRYTGAYLKLRRPNAELAFGGGRRDSSWVEHGAVYVKGARWSAAIGGARGDNGVDFEHFAASWHPLQRGGGPGARLIAERRSSERYFTELMIADRANFNHFSVWGQYGMDQWPHRKTFEAVDDIMRYVRPPIFDHQYTVGVGVVGGRYEVRNGTEQVTLDGRFYPIRLVHRTAPTQPPDPRTGVRGYVIDRILPAIMLGGFREMNAGTTTWVGQIDFPPFSLYGESPMRTGAQPYLFVQYRQGLPF
ncbi:MAG: hypothetical protein EXR95_02375 [Gemmatimonadetes bacterium]|nr:hypothetical protein [Gemmatimonadota bacterium]